jgi:hypothetical protein
VYEAVNVAHAASGRAGGFLARSWCDSGPARLLAQAGLWTRSGTFWLMPPLKKFNSFFDQKLRFTYPLASIKDF